MDGRQEPAADAAPGGHTAVEHAREELGAAATHGHRAMAHEEHATHEAHRGRGTSEGHGQHDGHAGHGEDMFKRPFWVSLVLTIPVLVYAELLQEVLGYTAPGSPAPPGWSRCWRASSTGTAAGSS